MTATAPVLPAIFINSARSETPVTGATINVANGGDFQAALNSAQLGDEIVIAAGGTVTGNFMLPNKVSGSGWITIRTAGALPTEGVRVSPAGATNFAKIRSTNGGAAIGVDLGAHHYRFIGVEIHSTVHTNAVCALNEWPSTQQAHHIYFDCCFIHGSPTLGSHKGISFQVAYGVAINCYINDIKTVGNGDSNAIGMWRGPGPFKIVNNYLEGAGENFLVGGASAGGEAFVPCDIEFRRNHCFKPLSWCPTHASYGGVHWSVKNIFELKNAKRVLADGNIFENNWVDGQSGMALLFTVRNDEQESPYSTVQDVTFTNNKLINSAGGVNILGNDNIAPSVRAARILIRNLLLDNIGWDTQLGTNGRLFQILRGPTDVKIDHVTGWHVNHTVLIDEEPIQRFDFTNNLAAHNAQGVLGGGTSSGTETLNNWVTGGYTFEKNVLIGTVLGTGNPANYPPNNEFPTDWNVFAAANFVDWVFLELDNNYRLVPASGYNNAGTDGKDIGADIDAIEAAYLQEDYEPGNGNGGGNGGEPPPMGAFTSLTAAETRAKAKVADGTWVNAHAARKFDGTLVVRVQRKMAVGQPQHGGWVEIQDDSSV